MVERLRKREKQDRPKFWRAQRQIQDGWEALFWFDGTLKQKTFPDPPANQEEAAKVCADRWGGGSYKIALLSDRRLPVGTLPHFTVEGPQRVAYPNPPPSAMPANDSAPVAAAAPSFDMASPLLMLQMMQQMQAQADARAEHRIQAQRLEMQQAHEQRMREMEIAERRYAAEAQSRIAAEQSRGEFFIRMMQTQNAQMAAAQNALLKTTLQQLHKDDEASPFSSVLDKIGDFAGTAPGQVLIGSLAQKFAPGVQLPQATHPPQQEEEEYEDEEERDAAEE